MSYRTRRSRNLCVGRGPSSRITREVVMHCFVQLDKIELRGGDDGTQGACARQGCGPMTITRGSTPRRRWRRTFRVARCRGRVAFSSDAIRVPPRRR